MKRACLDEEAIDVENVLSVQLHDVGKLDAALHEPDAIGVSLGEAVVVEVAAPTDDIEHYTGAYDVTPLITAQVLATRDKLMDDNVRVDMIPTREENNAAGGVTFIVGG